MVMIESSLSPHVLGRVIEYLREYFAPKDIQLPPEDLFLNPDVSDFCEWSLYLWMDGDVSEVPKILLSSSSGPFGPSRCF